MSGELVRAAGDAPPALVRVIEDAIAARTGLGVLDPFELPIVVACRDRISGTLAQLPMVNYRGSQPTAEQPPICLRPDPTEHRGDTMARLAHNLTGPGYAWLIATAWYADTVTPAAVRVVDANEATGLFTPSGQLETVIWQGERYDPSTREAFLLRYRYDHVGAPGPDSGPLGKCRRPVEYLCALWQMAGSFWEAGFPSLALVLEQALTSTQRREIKQALIGAWARTHEPAVIDRGGKLEPVGSNAVESQLVESIDVANTEIARAFGMTPSLVNVRTGYSLTYSTTEGELGQWLKLGFSDYLRIVEAAWSDLRPYGQTVQFDTSVLLRTAPADRWATYAIGWGRWITTEEIRREEGLPWPPPAPLPNGPNELASSPTSSAEPDAVGVFDMPTTGVNSTP